MSSQQSYQGILSDESQVFQSDDTQLMNISAGKAVGEVVRSTLGPRGMDKLLIDSAGMGIITNNGASIIREMDIRHPAANMVATVGKKQEETAGDGTTTAVAVTSALLKHAEALLDKGIHPTLIAEGYALAVGAAKEELESIIIEMDDRMALIESVVGTAMDGQSAASSHKTLVRVTTEAAIAAKEGGADPADHVRVLTDVGGTVGDTWLMDGVAITNERAHPEIPPMVKDAAIAVLNGGIEITGHNREINVTPNDSEALNAFHSHEQDQLDLQVDHLLNLGVDAVITKGDIAKTAQSRFANHGIYVTQRQSPTDIETAAQATGATVESEATALSESDLGTAETVVERIVGGKKQTSIEGVPRENAVSIVLRGGTRNVVDEIHRTVDNALNTAGVVLENNAIVPGGGGAETFVATKIRERARGVDDRTQLAITAFADALEVVPRTLAENTGQNPIDCVIDLRHAYDDGAAAAAINAETGDVVDARKYGIVDALWVKTQALESATQVAIMLLGIDDIVVVGDLAGGAVTNNTAVEDDEL